MWKDVHKSHTHTKSFYIVTSAAADFRIYGHPWPEPSSVQKECIFSHGDLSNISEP